MFHLTLLQVFFKSSFSLHRITIFAMQYWSLIFGMLAFCQKVSTLTEITKLTWHTLFPPSKVVAQHIAFVRFILALLQPIQRCEKLWQASTHMIKDNDNDKQKRIPIPQSRDKGVKQRLPTVPEENGNCPREAVWLKGDLIIQEILERRLKQKASAHPSPCRVETRRFLYRK